MWLIRPLCPSYYQFGTGVGLGRYDFQLPVSQVHVRPLEIDDFTPAQARKGGGQGYQGQVLRFGAPAPLPCGKPGYKGLKGSLDRAAMARRRTNGLDCVSIGFQIVVGIGLG